MKKLVVGRINGDDGQTSVAVEVRVSGGWLTAEEHSRMLISLCRMIASNLSILTHSDFGADNTLVTFTTGKKKAK